MYTFLQPLTEEEFVDFIDYYDLSGGQHVKIPEGVKLYGSPNYPFSSGGFGDYMMEGLENFGVKDLPVFIKFNIRNLENIVLETSYQEGDVYGVRLPIYEELTNTRKKVISINSAKIYLPWGEINRTVADKIIESNYSLQLHSLVAKF